MELKTKVAQLMALAAGSFNLGVSGFNDLGLSRQQHGEKPSPKSRKRSASSDQCKHAPAGTKLARKAAEGKVGLPR